MYAGHFWAITMSIDDYQPWKAFTLFSGEFNNVLIYAFFVYSLSPKYYCCVNFLTNIMSDLRENVPIDSINDIENRSDS